MIIATAHIITALQTIVMCNVDPMAQGVVTVGCIHGGAAPDVIPDVVELQGTLRAFEESVMQLLRVRVRQIVAQVAAGLGVAAAVTFAEPSTPATVNDPALARLVRETAAALVGPQRVRSDYRIMATEDCAFFLQAVPGVYAFVGAGNRAKGMTEPHHSPRFQIDEDALPLSAALLTAAALRMLAA